MIDSNNINVMREKLRKISGGGSGVQEEIERIDNLIGSSPIPGTQRTITSSLNYLYDHLGGDIKTFTYIGDGGDHMELTIPEDMNFCLGISGKGANNTDVSMMPFIPFVSVGFITHYRNPGATNGGQLSGTITTDIANRKLSFYGASDDGGRCDVTGQEYTVYYI